MDIKEKFLQFVGVLFGIILIPVLISLGMKLSADKAEKYPWSISFYNRTYSEGNQLTDSENDKFKTLDECRDWAVKKADWYDLKEGEWDFECGRGCKYTDQTISGGKRIETFECEEISK